uniref:Methyltransferase type 11 domain-containing protein n=1 Tax=Monopterus albus TaxID=43700 RepID=A0A3Q3R4Q3_MONAL
MEKAASQLEKDHVHSVYDKIAPYFNDSRYKAWPKVQQFMLDLQPGSIVADIGCGNGKYLHINKEAFKLGCDVCRPLVDFAWSQGHEVQMCDGLHLPYRDGCFDAVLSIAGNGHTHRHTDKWEFFHHMHEQKRRKFEKQDIFVPWNPNPYSSSRYRREHAKPRRRATAQSVSEAIDSIDKHRKVRSTSSMADEEDLTCTTPQQRTQRLWFFSRSLDSVFDFGSLAISRSSSRDLCTLSSPTGEAQGTKASWRGRGRGLIKQVSSFFSPPSVIGSEEDVFNSVTDLTARQNNPGEGKSVSVSLAQECGSVALPDLVPFQTDHLKQCGDESGGGPQGEELQESTPDPQETEVEGSCLRYYHVFREGELVELIEDHVEELHVKHTYFDHSNWCVVAEKVQLWKI